MNVPSEKRGKVDWVEGCGFATKHPPLRLHNRIMHASLKHRRQQCRRAMVSGVQQQEQQNMTNSLICKSERDSVATGGGDVKLFCREGNDNIVVNTSSPSSNKTWAAGRQE